MEEQKRCFRCLRTKPIEAFGKDLSKRDGRHYMCRECRGLEKAGWFKVPSRKDLGMKKCYMCQQYKPFSEFSKNRNKFTGLSDECKICHPKVAKRWATENPEKYRAISLRAVKKNSGTLQGRLRGALSNGIRQSIRQNKAGRHWEDLVGFSLDSLIHHLESQFTEGMTWSAYGHGPNKWHIDHVIPQSWFCYETAESYHFKVCWSLENLQPMWGRRNDSKGNRYAGIPDNHRTREEMSCLSLILGDEQ